MDPMSKIAIVGMASIFPEAKNLEQYWQNIVEEIDCITEVPSSHWNIEDYYDPNPDAVDKTYSNKGGFIPEIDFNPIEFGLPPNILENTDVSQLLSLVVAREAFKDAGYYSPDLFKKSVKDKTGVILGVCGGQKLIIPLTARLQYPVWDKVLKSCGLSEADREKIINKIKLKYIQWDENSFPGLLGNVISGRIANRFDLGGINCTVDAACASSLTAVEMAVNELESHRCDMMLTGGVDTDNSPLIYMCFSKTPAFSKKGICRPFDARADGMLTGEGIGMLVLKRLDDAIIDKDRIYAVICGIGSSSDGFSKSVYAPRAEGQVLAIKRAYEDAGYSPTSIGLLEAHGTGTVAGDPEEFGSMRTVFGTGEDSGQHIALGSVKSQIGHTKGAAGAAGMIKAALALHQQILPPVINVEQPNPTLNIQSSPFYLNTTTRPWFLPEGSSPRRAGVSSFGFGGINVHITMEEHKSDRNSNNWRIFSKNKMVIMHAPSPEELLESLKKSLDDLECRKALSNFMKLICESKKAKIPKKSARIGFCCTSVEQAIALLKDSIMRLSTEIGSYSWEDTEKGIYYQKESSTGSKKIVALFPGQGSQRINMGKELTCFFPPVREEFTEMDKIFTEEGSQPLTKVIFPIPVFDEEQKEYQKKALTSTDNAQPAIAALSAGLYKLLRNAGFKPDFTAGHSFGELTALWAAGVYDDETFFRLARSRGKAMMPPDENPDFDAGTMLAVMGNLDKIMQKIQGLKDIIVANINSNNQIVLAGSTDAVKRAQLELDVEGFSTVMLPVSAAFHTDQVKHAMVPFAKTVDKISMCKPQIAVYSNVTAGKYPDNEKEIRDILKKHIMNPVLFKDQMENIYDEGGYIFVECGPGNILTRLVDNTLKDRPHIAVALNAYSEKGSDRQLREAVLRLKIAGVALSDVDPFQKIDIESVDSIEDRLIIRLNGSNYVSEKTRVAFENSLKDGYMVQGCLTGRNSRQTDGSLQLIEEVETLTEPIQEPVNQKQSNSGDILDHLSLGDIIDYFRNKMTAGASDEDRSFTPGKAVQKSVSQKEIISEEILRENVSPKDDNRLQDVHLKEVPLEDINQEDIARENAIEEFAHHSEDLQTAETQHAAVTAVDGQSGGQTPDQMSDKKDLAASLLQVISDKTGYPAEMLELEMNLEGDLGIDSIKRVEIFGAMQEKFPSIKGIKPPEIAELHNLGEIIEYIHNKNISSSEVADDNVILPLKKKSYDKLEQTFPRGIVKHKYLSPPDSIDISISENYTFLVVDEGSDLTVETAKALLKKGRKVVVMSFPDHVLKSKRDLPDGAVRIVMDAVDDKCIKSVIGLITQKYGQIGAFIHLHPYFEIRDNEYTRFFEKEKIIIKGVFLISKYLKDSLYKAANESRGIYLTVCRLDGEFGFKYNDNISVFGGGLSGLTKTLNREWGQVFCRALDLDPQLSPQNAAGYIVDEMHDPDSGTLEVAYGKGGRKTITILHEDIDKNNLKSIPLDSSSLFLVSGGAKGITAQCVIRMAEVFKCKFILIGRSSTEISGFNHMEDDLGEKELMKKIMDQLLSTDEKPTPNKVQKIYDRIISKRKIQNNLDAIRRAGGEAVYIQADITNINRLKKIIPGVIKQNGDITGIIHGAGLLADALIENKTENDIESVYSVKVDGLLNLLKLVPPENLKYLILFSSVAGIYGNIGQSDYAVANETLNKLALYIKNRYPSCHVSAINWGPWDSGMVSPQLKILFEQNNIELIKTSTGVAMMLNEMSPSFRENVEVIIGRGLFTTTSHVAGSLKKYRIRRNLTLDKNPFLKDHIINGQAVLPIVCAVEWLAGSCEHLYPNYKLFSCEEAKLLKGIIFDGKNSDEYVLDLEEQKKDEEEVVFQSLLWSRGNKGRKVYHYSALVRLLKEIPDAPFYDSNDFKTEKTAADGYKLYMNGTLFHGPCFQGINKIIKLTREKVILECSMPGISDELQGQFQIKTINPFLVDIQYQGMLIWVDRFCNAVSLPIKSEYFEIFRTIPFNSTFYASLEIRTSTDYKMTADISAFDKDGKLYMRTQGAEVSLLKKRKWA